MPKKISRYWWLLAISLAIGLTWLYITSGPKMTVEKNTARQTMQQRLEADKIFVSYGNEPRSNEPFKDVFTWTIVLDGLSFNSHKYRKHYPSDGVWITGNKPEEERCYIFTNRTPPSDLKELLQYSYR